MSRPVSHSLSLPLASSLPPVSRLLVSAALVLARWDERRRSRLALERLTDAQLKDIGLSKAAASLEMAKPFWRE